MIDIVARQLVIHDFIVVVCSRPYWEFMFGISKPRLYLGHKCIVRAGSSPAPRGLKHMGNRPQVIVIDKERAYPELVTACTYAISPNHRDNLIITEIHQAQGDTYNAPKMV